MAPCVVEHRLLKGEVLDQQVGRRDSAPGGGGGAGGGRSGRVQQLASYAVVCGQLLALPARIMRKPLTPRLPTDTTTHPSAANRHHRARPPARLGRRCQVTEVTQELGACRCACTRA